MKTLIKKNRKIVGFVDQRFGGQWFYVFGRPSQSGGYIAFDCMDKAQGIARIEDSSNLTFKN